MAVNCKNLDSTNLYKVNGVDVVITTDSRLSDSRPPDGSAGGDLTGTYPNPTVTTDTITYAKMQNVSAASKLLGRGDSGSGDPEEITLGTNLSMSGTTINATGGVGTTNLGFNNRTAIQYDITSDTGTDATVTSATGTLAGAMPAADKVKTDFISVTQAVDLDSMESDIATNNAKVTNATHTGDVTGSGALTISSKAVDIAMLSDGTDGEIITWDASGVATTVATGASGQVLTSNGVGTEPTFQSVAGTGDVVGPVSSTDGNFTLYDGVSGKLIKDGPAVGALASLATVGTTEIDDDAVSNAKASEMAANTVKVNNTASLANPVDIAVAEDRLLGRLTGGNISALTETQTTTLINDFVGDAGGGGTKGAVPAPASGDAAANKFLKADGNWVAPAGSGDVVGPASAVDSGFALFDGVTGKLLKDGGVTASNSQLAQMAANTVKVNNTSSAASPTDLSIPLSTILGRTATGDITTFAMNQGQVKVNGTETTSGLLVIGQIYVITNYIATDDFTNVGASSNVTGEKFEATGTTPTDWTNGSTLQKHPTLTLLGDVEQRIDYGSDPLSISGSPTTEFPQNITSPTDADFWKTATSTAVENTVPGQTQWWRFIFNYSGKSANDNAGLQVKIRNILSGFEGKSEITLPSGETGNTAFIATVITIADGASLPTPFGTGQGYQIWIESTSGIEFELVSLTRISVQHFKRTP